MAAVPLEHYVKIKNNYCLGYFGDDEQLLMDIYNKKKSIEKRLPQLNLYIVCKDDKVDLIPDGIPQSELANYINKFAHYKIIEGLDDIF